MSPFFGPTRYSTPMALAAIMVLLPLQSSWADWQQPIVTEHVTLTPIAKIEKNSRFFTQGLAVDNGTLFESNGQYGQSTVCRTQILEQRLAVPSCKSMDANYFAEGLSIVNGNVFQLTWRENTVFEYHKETLEVVSKNSYEGQGWGLTNNTRHFLMSDGSNKIQFKDLATFRTEKTLPVFHQGKKLNSINELEWINNKLWANQWYSDSVFIIDINTGLVDEIIDFSHLLPDNLRPHSQAVLNGIGFDVDKKQLYITGKHWPYYYLFQLSDH